MHDEKLAFTFAVSTLACSQDGVAPPMQNAFRFPLDVAEPKKALDKSGPPMWCAERKAGGLCYER